MSSKELAKFENKYGEERIIHLTRSGLRVKRNSSTVILSLNSRISVLMAAKIKARRIELGFSLEELCKKAGIATTTPKSRMWEIENCQAKTGLRLGTLYALAIALECTPDSLMPTIEEVLSGSSVKEVTERTLKINP